MLLLICISSTDYTVDPVLSGRSEKKTNYLLMQAKSIAECFKPSAMLLTFIKLQFVIGVFSLSFLGGCFKTSFCCIEYLHVLSVLWSSALFNCAFYTT